MNVVAHHYHVTRYKVQFEITLRAELTIYDALKEAKRLADLLKAIIHFQYGSDIITECYITPEDNVIDLFELYKAEWEALHGASFDDSYISEDMGWKRQNYNNIDPF